MAKQKTIKNTVYVSGKGVHSGKAVNMVLRPARADTGIIFRRIDEQLPDIKVAVNRTNETPLCTVLVGDGHQILTIEHLMAALCGMEIDNIIIELDASEVPIMDGSASPFLFLFESAGLEKQTSSRHVVEVQKTVRVENGDQFVELSPCSHLRFELSIDFDHPAIKKTSQTIQFNFESAIFAKMISRARTFGFVKDLEYFHKNNHALGASLDNAIGLDDKGVMNPEGLRYPDEFVKHKLLDAIGDLYVIGPLQGLYRAHKPSHTLNNQLLKKLVKVQS